MINSKTGIVDNKIRDILTNLDAHFGDDFTEDGATTVDEIIAIAGTRDILGTKLKIHINPVPMIITVGTMDTLGTKMKIHIHSDPMITTAGTRDILGAKKKIHTNPDPNLRSTNIKITDVVADTIEGEVEVVKEMIGNIMTIMTNNISLMMRPLQTNRYTLTLIDRQNNNNHLI